MVDVSALGKPLASIPFTLVHGVPVVAWTVNHRKHQNFAVDTGAQWSLINSSRAGELGIRIMPSTGKLTFLAPGSSSLVGNSQTKLIPVNAGRLRLRLGLVAMDLSGIEKAVGVPIAGVLGYNVLRALPTAIDYNEKRLLIYSGSKFRPPDGGSTVLSLGDNVREPVIAASLTIGGEDLGRVRAELDTGLEFSADVLGRFARDHNLETLRGWKRGKTEGFLGPEEVFLGQTGFLAYGGARFELTTVLMSLSAAGQGGGADFDMSMGAPNRSTGVVVLDVPAGKIYLGRSSAAAGPSTCPP